jgi:hypothetical protein
VKPEVSFGVETGVGRISHVKIVVNQWWTWYLSLGALDQVLYVLLTSLLWFGALYTFNIFGFRRTFFGDEAQRHSKDEA